MPPPQTGVIMASHLFAPNQGAVTRESVTLRMGTAKDWKVGVGETGRYTICISWSVSKEKEVEWRQRTLLFVRYTTPDLHCWLYDSAGWFRCEDWRESVVRGGLWYSVVSPGSGVYPLPSASITQLFFRLDSFFLCMLMFDLLVLAEAVGSRGRQGCGTVGRYKTRMGWNLTTHFIDMVYLSRRCYRDFKRPCSGAALAHVSRSFGVVLLGQARPAAGREGFGGSLGGSVANRGLRAQWQLGAGRRCWSRGR